MKNLSFGAMIATTGLIALASGCAQKQTANDDFIVAPGAIATDRCRSRDRSTGSGPPATA